MKRFSKRFFFLFKFHKSIPFIKGFFISKEVKVVTKAFFAILIVGYVALPLDIVPDFIFLFGFLDDVTMVIFLLQKMVEIAPNSLKEKHELLD